MFRFLPGPVKGSLIVLIILINTLFWMPILVIGAILKLILPVPFLRTITTKLSIASATNWVSINSSLFWLFHKIDWKVSGVDKLSMDEWYFVNCNHQSWADIPIAQKVLNRKVPMLKFFLKQELIWVPVLGICWWALDFPFMKRYSAAQVAKNPELAGKDLETTRKACQKFKTTPVSVFNFLEGTRNTPEKHKQQESPFKHLLKPKAGGAAFVLGSMGSQMNTMLDISIVYPSARNSFWDLICGRISEVTINVKTIDIPPEYLGKDYANDATFKADFQEWINAIWKEKDQLLETMGRK
jgi:1-acyl-sn-glycerol-3-phosphate acyltransferase